MKIIKRLQEDGSFKEYAYYSVREIAQMYSVTHITIRLWISKGILKGIKLGKCVYISKEDVIEFQKNDSKNLKVKTKRGSNEK